MQIDQIVAFLEDFAPPALAEPWDNVGLLVGHSAAPVTRIITCLTVSHATVEEAVEGRAGLIVSHHPLPFHPLKQITDATHEGALLLRLIESRIAVYSPHTAFDSARDGINFHLASLLGLQQIEPLAPIPESSVDSGKGRMGIYSRPMTLGDVAKHLSAVLRLQTAQIVGPPDRLVQRVGVACGSAGEFLPLAINVGCDCFVTGELRFHDCQRAFDAGISLVLAGHYASERFAVEHLANVLAKAFSDLTVWASRNERDPLRWL